MIKRVLVTGGLGRLGSYVVKELSDAYDVTILDLNCPRGDSNQIRADILDLDAVTNAVKGHDAVIHLAALDAGVGATEHDFYRTNTVGTWNVLSACQEHGIRKATICSSIAAYGLEKIHPWTQLDYFPFNEKHPLRPVVAYDLSKQVTERIAEAFSRRGVTQITCLRPSWIMFPDKAHGFDERARREDLSNSFSDQTLPPYRSYVRPDDTARAFRLAMEAELAPFEVFNIGATDSFSSVPTRQFIKSYFGSVPTSPEHDFETNPRASAFAVGRAARVLGWRSTGDWPSYLAEITGN